MALSSIFNLPQASAKVVCCLRLSAVCRSLHTSCLRHQMGDMTDDWEEYEDIILDDDSVRTGVLTVALCMRTTHPTDRVRAVHH